MTHRLTATALFVCAAWMAAPASAQSLKPGLWEMNTKMQSTNPEIARGMENMQKQLAAMPPEQRKMMEDMMAKQGVKMGDGKGGGMSVKMCMTKEMAERHEVPMRHEGDCTTTHSPMVGGKMKMSFTCTKPPSSGEGEMSFNGDASYNMKMNVTSSNSGKPETMNMESSGKWLGSDCGDIKPIAMPKSK